MTRHSTRILQRIIAPRRKAHKGKKIRGIGFDIEKFWGCSRNSLSLAILLVLRSPMWRGTKHGASLACGRAGFAREKMRYPGSKILSAIIWGVVAVAGAGCGKNTGGGNTGALNLFPSTFGSATVVQTVRTGEINKHLGSFDVDRMVPHYFGFGIYQEKVTTYHHCNGVTFATGTFSTDEVKTTLRDRSYEMTKRDGVEIYGQGKSGMRYGFLGNQVVYTDSDEKLNQVIATVAGKADSLGGNQALAALARAAKYKHFVCLSNTPIGLSGLQAHSYSGDLTASNTMRFQALFKFNRASDAANGIGSVKPLIGDRFRKHNAEFADWKAGQKGDTVVIEITARGDMKAIIADMLTIP